MVDLSGLWCVSADPGASGAIAVIPPLINARRAVPYAVKMPADDLELLESLREVRRHGPCAGIIEKVHSMPDQGVSSTFKFGMSYGAIRMAFTAADIPYQLVTPQAWQKEYGLIRPKRRDGEKRESITDKKNRHKAEALELFPGIKITHAVADALLLAEYLRRMVMR